jgi:hypothetical protein
MLKVEVCPGVNAVSRRRSASIFREKCLGLLDYEDEGTRALRNGSNYLPSGTVSHPRRLQSGLNVS